MTIKPIVRVRKLTSFSDVSGAKAHFPVLLYVYDRGKKYYLSTSFTTNDAKFNGSFNDKGVERDVNRANTDALDRLVDMLTSWYNQNYMGRSVDYVKDKLSAMCKGVSDDDGGRHLPEWIDAFADTKKASTRDVYLRTSKLIREYDAKIDICDVTLDWLEEFVRWLRYERVNHNHGGMEIGLKQNTIAIHLRNMRAVFKWCGKPSKGMGCNRVFEEYSIKDDKNVHRFIMNAQQVADFRDYPCEPWQEKYRDFCMLSLYLGGCNPNDLLLVKGLTNGRFVRSRGKTGSLIDLPVCDEAMAIIEKYRGSEHLLMFMDTMKSYETFAQHLNRNIKTIGLAVKVEDKVGKMRRVEYHPMFPEMIMYTFRYTFGDICANLEGVSQQDVGLCMAHAWAAKGNVTVARYINNHRSVVDRTMKRFVEHLRGFKGRPKEVIDEEIRKRDGLV